MFGTTPVYRFNTATWEVEPVVTTGANPGWIHDHTVRLAAEGKVFVSGGKVAVEVDGIEEHVELTGEYMLDLAMGVWTQT